MNQKELIESWLIRTKAVEKAHFSYSIKFNHRHLFLGGSLIIASTLATALTGLVEVEDLAIENNDFFQFFRVMITLCVPVISAMLTFLKLETRAARHHDAAANFSSLKRRLSIILAKLEDKQDINVGEELAQISEKWDDLTLHMPAIPRSKEAWRKAIIESESEITS